MTTWEFVLLMFVSMFYITYICALVITFKHRKRMKTNWFICLISLPLAPFLIAIEYIELLVIYRRD